MIPRTRVALLAALGGCAGCACSAVHEGADAAIDAASAPDGSMDAAAVDDARDAGFPGDVGCGSIDVGPRDLGTNDSGVCRPGPPQCNTDDDCAAWGAAVGPTGAHVISRCMGYRCTLGWPCETWCTGLTACACGTTACDFDQVCVSDRPGGPERCALDCEGR